MVKKLGACWSLIAYVAISIGAMIGFPEQPVPSCVNGFVIQDPVQRVQSIPTRQLGENRHQNRHKSTCTESMFQCNHPDTTFALHAAAKKRYGYEIRKAKRDSNRQKRRERAARVDQGVNVGISDDAGASPGINSQTSTRSSSSRLVRVLKWPFRKIRNALRS